MSQKYANKPQNTYEHNANLVFSNEENNIETKGVKSPQCSLFRSGHPGGMFSGPHHYKKAGTEGHGPVIQRTICALEMEF
jgi:hypothetical protein